MAFRKNTLSTVDTTVFLTGAVLISQQSRVRASAREYDEWDSSGTVVLDVVLSDTFVFEEWLSVVMHTAGHKSLCVMRT